MHNMEKCGRGKGRPQGCSLRSHRRRRLAPLPPPFSPAPMLRHVVYASLLHFGVETAQGKKYQAHELPPTLTGFVGSVDLEMIVRAILYFCYRSTLVHSPLRRSKVTSRQIAQKAPYPVDVEAGKTYFWCACGQSKKQPFCDGSHKATDFVPVAWTAEETRKSYFCGCKHSKTEPLCDGSHAKL